MSASIRDTLARIRTQTPGAMGTEAKFYGFCIAHTDKNKRSFSAGLSADGNIVMSCFAGCSFEQLCEAHKITPAECFADGRGGEGATIPRDSTATLHQSPGCTLDAFAEAKRLPVEFLRVNGLSQISYQGALAVRFPYYDANGTVKATRYRIASTGDDRFRWKSGDKTMLYGWNRRKEALNQKYVVMCEGESDVLTLWHHGIPAVSIPGASTYRDERDAPYFEGVETIYLVIEPDKGGETVRKWLGNASIRDRVRILDLGDHKDPSGLYLAVGERFVPEFGEAMDAAPKWTDLTQDDTGERLANAYEACKGLAHEPDILSRVAEVVTQLGLAGESDNVKLMYLVVTSRLLDKPVSAVVKGPSSAGKSFLVETVLSLFDPSAYYALSGMSERALAYSEEPLAHRFLVIYEAAGVSSEFATYLLRSLISEGRVRYETVEKTNEGVRARLIEREGPTGVILTTTAAKLHPENETRLLSLVASDTPEHTKRVMLAIAALAKDGNTGKAPIDLTAWHALQEWLAAGATQVVVPFAIPLADLIPPDAVRLRRDFGLIIALIRAHALLHRASRQLDRDGRIEATFADYGAVRALVSDLIAAGVDATVPESVRQTVHTVRMLVGETRGSFDDGSNSVPLAAVAKALRLDKSAASRRIKVAIEREYLHNLESKRGKPMRITVGDPLPDEKLILPTVVDLMQCCSVADTTGGVYVPSPPRDVDPESDADPAELFAWDSLIETHEACRYADARCPSCDGPIEAGRRFVCQACTNRELAEMGAA